MNCSVFAEPASAFARMAASGDAEAEADKVLTAVVSAGFAKQLPAGLEEESTLLVANLPFAATSLEVGAHFSWYAPVVRVTRLDKTVTGTDSSYLVTFVDVDSAKAALQGQVGVYPHAGGSSRPLRVQQFKSQESSSSWFGW